MKRVYKWLSGFMLGIFCLVAWPAMADSGHVWQLVADSFPTPKFMVKPDTPKRVAVMAPATFKNGNGYRQSGFGASRHFDTNDPRMFSVAVKS